MTIWRTTRANLSSRRLRRKQRPGKMSNGSFQFEVLEDRRVLAVATLGGVSGTVFLDANENSMFDPGEEVAGARVEVFLDADNDGMFERQQDDLIFTTNADASGAYEVSGLVTGNYFVVQPTQVASGLSLGQQVSELVAVNGAGVAGLTIDSFATPSSPVTALEPAGTTDSGVTPAVESIGGERDLTATLLSVTGGVGFESASIAAGGGLLVTNPTNFAVGNYLIDWDGVDGGGGLDPTGLAGINLIDGSVPNMFEGICLQDVNPDKPGLELVLRVFTDADNFSEVTFSDLAVDQNQNLYVPFDSNGANGPAFVDAGAGGGADFTNVGAVQLEIIDSVDGTDFNVGQLGVLGTDLATVDILNASEVPLIDLQALTDGIDADDPDDPDVPILTAGNTVTWTYEVTNAGTIDVTTVELTDDQLGPITNIVDQGDGDDVLAAGEVWRYVAFGTVIDGSYSNAATVVVDSAVGMATASDTSNYRGGVSAIDIEKLTNGQQADNIDDMDVPMLDEGAEVVWTYIVTNTGSFDLDAVTVSDSALGLITNIVDAGDGDEILQAGESWTYEAMGTAIGGEYENLGTATGVGEDQMMASDEDFSHYIGIPAATPAIDVELATDGVDADDPGTGPDVFVGDLVTFTYTVSNPGDLPLLNVQVSDDNGTTADETDDFFAMFTGGDLDGDGELDLDEIWTYQAFRIATLGDYSGTATASAESADMTAVTDADASHHRGIELPNGMFGWHNDRLVSDVNRDGVVAGTDAGTIVNELILHNVSDPVTGKLDPPPPTRLYDTDDDGFIAARDVIIVLNDIQVPPALDLDSAAVGSDSMVTLPINSTFVLLFNERLTINHEGNSMLSSASLQIQGFVMGEESLDADTTDTAIEANFDEATGILSLTGTDTVTNYVRVLRTVTLDLITPGASRSPITVDVVVGDGNADSNMATVTVEREFVVVPPALDLNGSETGADVSVVLPLAATSVSLLDARLTIMQGTQSMLASASLNIEGFVTGEEALSIDTTGTAITASFDAVSGVLSLTGLDTPANYELALQTAMLDLATPGGSRAPISISVVVSDGSKDSNTATVMVERNVPATVDLNGTEDGNDVVVVLPDTATTVPLFDERFTIEQGTASMLASASLSIQGFVAGEEALAVDTTGTSITAAYDNLTGILILSGTDTLANYESVLETAALELTTAGGIRAPILVDVAVNDGNDDSNTATVTAQITAPTIDLNGTEEGMDVAVELPETATAVQLLDERLTIGQGSASMLVSATLTIQGYVAGEESLSVDTSGTSITADFDAVTGILTLTGTDTPANYESVLQTAMLQLTTAGGTRTPILVDVTVSDGSDESNTATVTVVATGP